MVKNKKAQMKIQQMAFMLIAVVLFFSLVGMLVVVVKFSGLKESAAVLEEKNAMLLVTKIANSPEFSCGQAFGSGRVNCIDADKVMMLKESIVKYSGFWGVSDIEIRKIYPKSEDIVCNLENYPDCSIIQLLADKMTGTGVSNFVALCRKATFEGIGYDKCELARIIVSYEEK